MRRTDISFSMMLLLRMTHCALLAFSVVNAVGCVSGGIRLQQGQTALPDAKRETSSEKSFFSIQGNYEPPEEVVAERLKEIREVPSSSGLTSEKVDAHHPQAGSTQNRPQLSKFEALVRSERWIELIAESESEWQECLRSALQFSKQCREVGRARAVAHVRVGHPDAAWSIQEAFAERRADSEDALVFAGLLLDVGAMALCVQLTDSALQWEPVEARLALLALRAKCLRQSHRIDEARATVRMALSEFPLDVHLLLESAFIAIGENNLTQGCEILEQLYSKRERIVSVAFNWAQCLVKRRDSENASRVIEVGRREWPLERGWLILSGELELLEGRVEQARQLGFDYLSAADQRDPLRPQAERLIREKTVGER